MPRPNRRPRRRRAALATRRAVAALLLTGVLGSGALAVPALAAPGAMVLAVSEEPVGPEPAPRGADDNPARELGGYEDREVPFTWGAAWLLTFLGLSGVAVMLLVYYRSVARPGDGGARRA
jgi:formate-dependent nitrite reductase membrane component NrfD